MDFYQHLRKKIRNMLPAGPQTGITEYLLLAPDLFHLLTRLSLDKEVPAGEKAKVLAAMAYFVAPFDLLPEALLGVTALIDDVAVTLYVVHGLLNRSPAPLVQKYWCGEEDLLLVSQKMAKTGEAVVGSRFLWDKIKNAIPGKNVS